MEWERTLEEAHGRFADEWAPVEVQVLELDEAAQFRETPVGDVFALGEIECGERRAVRHEGEATVGEIAAAV